MLIWSTIIHCAYYKISKSGEINFHQWSRVDRGWVAGLSGEKGGGSAMVNFPLKKCMFCWLCWKMSKMEFLHPRKPRNPQNKKCFFLTLYYTSCFNVKANCFMGYMKSLGQKFSWKKFVKCYKEGQTSWWLSSKLVGLYWLNRPTKLFTPSISDIKWLRPTITGPNWHFKELHR